MVDTRREPAWCEQAWGNEKMSCPRCVSLLMVKQGGVGCELRIWFPTSLGECWSETIDGTLYQCQHCHLIFGVERK